MAEDKLTKIVTIAGEVSQRLEEAAQVNVISTEGLVITTQEQASRKKILRRVALVLSIISSLGGLGILIYKIVVN